MSHYSEATHMGAPWNADGKMEGSVFIKRSLCVLQICLPAHWISFEISILKGHTFLDIKVNTASRIKLRTFGKIWKEFSKFWDIDNANIFRPTPTPLFYTSLRHVLHRGRKLLFRGTLCSVKCLSKALRNVRRSDIHSRRIQCFGKRAQTLYTKGLI